MIGFRQEEDRSRLPAIGLTMFGVTTPCVQAVTKALQMRYDCLVFHATGTGGQSMEKLVDSGMLEGVIDVTTTEVADFIVGGVMSAGEDRMGAIIRSRIPYVDPAVRWTWSTFKPRRPCRNNSKSVSFTPTTPR